MHERSPEMRKFLLFLAFVGIIVIAVMASGTFFAAREAKEFITAQVDKERTARCKAMRADFKDDWDRAVDNERLAQSEDRLNARAQQIDAYCREK